MDPLELADIICRFLAFIVGFLAICVIGVSIRDFFDWLNH